MYRELTQECSPLLQSCTRAMMWRVCHVTICQGSTSRLALIHVQRLAFVPGASKVRIVRYRDIGLHHRGTIRMYQEVQAFHLCVLRICNSASFSSFLVGGLAQNLPNFQMAPIPFLSVPTCSNSSPHDILKVSKQIDHNLPVGHVKHETDDLGGFTYRFFMGF